MVLIRIPRMASCRIQMGCKASHGYHVYYMRSSSRVKISEAQQWFLQRLEQVGRGSLREKLQCEEANMHDIAKESWSAMSRIYGSGIIETPLQKAPWLLDEAEAEYVALKSADPAEHSTSVYLKLESRQITGSFKARGATNKILSLDSSDLERGIVTSSTGNHALAIIGAIGQLAHAGVNCPTTVYVPSTITAQKAKKLQKAATSAGVTVLEVGKDCLEAELAARNAALQSNQTYISPYNDMHVISGQGTIAYELLMSLDANQFDAIFVPVGGGGLMSGIASVLKSLSPRIRIIGCQPERSQAMRDILDRKQSSRPENETEVTIRHEWDTLSDGTAGGVEEDSVTIDICRDFVDQWVSVSEEEIAKAMVTMERHTGEAIEGSAGVAIAGYKRLAKELSGQGFRNAVVICCGSNVAPEIMDQAYALYDIIQRQ